MPCVSIVIPTYNRSRYLPKAIDSVLAQILTDIEIIIVDDGSQDDTPEIVKNYTDTRIHYLYQVNAGRSAARNNGIKASSGTFIALLDDDDVYLPHKLKNQVEFLETHPKIDAVASAGYKINDNDKMNGVFQPWTHEIEINLPDCIHNTGLPPSSLLFRRSCLETMENLFDTRISYAEDNDFIIRFLLKGLRIVWLPQPLWSYRISCKRAGYVKLAPILSFHNILEEMFTRSDLPKAILEKKSEILCKSHLRVAGVAHCLDMTKLGKTHINKALEMDPSSMKGFPPGFAVSSANKQSH